MPLLAALLLPALLSGAALAAGGGRQEGSRETGSRQTGGPEAAEPAGADLRRAAGEGDEAAVRALLEGGAPVDAANRYGATALFFAADRGHAGIARLLVEAGAALDIEDRFYRMTALSRAVASNRREVALLLLDRGAAGAGAALAAAARDGDREMLRAALANGRFDERALRAARDAAAGEEAVLALLREAAPETETAAPVPAAELESLVGQYWREIAQEGFEIRLREEEGERSLVARRTGGEERAASGPPLRLRPAGAPRSFTAEEEEAEARFTFAGRGGMVERLVVEREGSRVAYDPSGEAESREPAGDPASAAAGRRGRAGASDPVPPERGPARPWPQFRGPSGSGVADGQGAPLRWNAVPDGSPDRASDDEARGSEGGGERGQSGIRWETALPGLGVSSPIIWGDRVFVVTAASAVDREFRIGLYGDVAPVEDDSEHEFTLRAFDLHSGAETWTTLLHRGVPLTKRHSKSSQANATPATDGERIVTVLGSVGLLLCHDLDGNLLWERSVGALNSGWFYDPGYQWGHASSPVIHEDTVILLADVHGGAFLGAFALGDGSPVWRAERNEVSTFSTPLVHRAGGSVEVVVNGTTIAGYDAGSGQRRWHLGPNSEIPIGVPLLGDGLLFVQAGYPPIRPIYAIRPGRRGDLSLASGEKSSDAIAWSHDRGGVYIPSPLFYRGILYLNANNGRLAAYDAETGERLYRVRLGGAGGSYAASPIAADGRLYFTSEAGDTFVVRAGPGYELLAKNSVDRIVMATPALSDGVLVLRALDRLYGISGEGREP